jgi:hypothetical protein
VVGLGAPAFAGVVVECAYDGVPVVIEINALRGGSPTVTADVPKDITSKARILKGTAPADATIDNTTLTITAYDSNDNPLDVATSMGLTLIVGRGGVGDKLPLTVPSCPAGDQVYFVSDFVGTLSSNGATCDSGPSERLYKTCK